MIQHRQHRMPFGTHLQDDDTTSFRLWAPAARQVELCLTVAEGEIILPMQAEAEGWFTLSTGMAHAGSLYFFRIDGRQHVPDPVSRFQPRDVHGPSCVVNPLAWGWHDAGWQGRPWSEAVIYELHVGAFSPTGGYHGIIQRLPYLAELGITAIELMPLADFPGQYGWGYDGVLLFAPEATYGRPDDLKNLVACAHAHGIMVFLDVVYNHFGPEGNFLHLQAPDFFHPCRHTPWGVAMNFEGASSYWIRQFFIHNALYWLEEYNMDGLRLDAVQAMLDDSRPHIVQELAAAVRCGPGAHRHIHLILENDDNAAHLLQSAPGGHPAGRDGETHLPHPDSAPLPEKPGSAPLPEKPGHESLCQGFAPNSTRALPWTRQGASPPDPEAWPGTEWLPLPRCQAQWNDDLHHVLHHMLTGETQGYYLDFRDHPLHHLGRALAEGFSFQGEPSPYRDGRLRGESSAHLPPTAFVSFLQNHDQVGNRLNADRIVGLAPFAAVRAATAIFLLAPQIPLLFMGQEWGCQQPFPFFCDLHNDLAAAVSAGRHREFEHSFRFQNARSWPPLPHPMAPDTFAAAQLEWDGLHTPEGQRWLALHKELFALRRREILPCLSLIGANAGRWRVYPGNVLVVTWRLVTGSRLTVLTNLSDRPLPAHPVAGRCFYTTHAVEQHLPPWYVGWFRKEV
ncbi:MAG: DUF3459 domain-containing protein [Magnetococcales bacterium]|nr:DUF3459 domain-containing protein [Magnetococcales bacterium]